LRNLYVIRHGETEWSVQQRMQGHADSALTAKGRAQADAHGRVLREVTRLDALMVSPSGRTRETAYAINAHVQAPISYHDELMERDCGDWTGLTADEVECQFPTSWRERGTDRYYHRPLRGENHEDMLHRVRDLLDSLLENGVGSVGVVTHGVMLRVIVTYFLGLSPVESVRVRHPNDLIYRLEFRLQQIEASHFLGGEGPWQGLLHRTDGETIAHFDRSRDPT
jgi:probable phosphoglycerate mutase